MRIRGEAKYDERVKSGVAVKNESEIREGLIE